jgi:hypothetical protein
VRHITAYTAETERIGAVAAEALAEIHSAIYGQTPEATRAWTDGDAILLVMRLSTEPTARGVEPPLAAIQRMVSAAVYRRTGESLRAAGTNLEVQRGLVVLAFERVRMGGGQETREPVPAGPVRGAD